MCYTGLCPYEISSGGHAGECSLPRDGSTPPTYPYDARCVEIELEIEEAEREEALGELDGFKEGKVRFVQAVLEVAMGIILAAAVLTVIYLVATGLS